LFTVSFDIDYLEFNQALFGF